MLAYRNLRILLTLILTVAALSLLLWSIASAGGITGQEAALDQSGAAYEVNRDERGDLWVSDNGAGEVWQIHPPTGAYTVYQGLSNANDARVDVAGSIWWTDSTFDNKLGRISPGEGKVTTWKLADT